MFKKKKIVNIQLQISPDSLEQVDIISTLQPSAINGRKFYVTFKWVISQA